MTTPDLRKCYIGAFQQTTSGLAVTNQQCYERSPNPCFAIYGFEYKPGSGFPSLLCVTSLTLILQLR